MISLVTKVSARTGVRGRRSGPKGFNCCDRCGVPLGRHPETPWRYHGTCQACGAVQIWAKTGESSAAETPSVAPPATNGRHAATGSSTSYALRGLSQTARRRQAGFDCCERCGRPLPAHPTQTWRFAGTCPACNHVQIWATRERSEERPAHEPLFEAVAPAAAVAVAVVESPVVVAADESPSPSPSSVAVLEREPMAAVPEPMPAETVRADRSHRGRHRAATLRTKFVVLMTVGFGTPPR